jgi:hypothetical protein
MPSKQLETVLSSNIYDAAVAGMKKATRLNHNAAATRKAACPQSFESPAALGILFQNERKTALSESRPSKNGVSSSHKNRNTHWEDEKQANVEIVWPSV